MECCLNLFFALSLGGETSSSPPPSAFNGRKESDDGGRRRRSKIEMITRERRGKVSPLLVPKALLRQFFDNFKFKGRAESDEKKGGMSRWDGVVRIVTAANPHRRLLAIHSRPLYAQLNVCARFIGSQNPFLCSRSALIKFNVRVLTATRATRTFASLPAFELTFSHDPVPVQSLDSLSPFFWHANPMILNWNLISKQSRKKVFSKIISN